MKEEIVPSLTRVRQIPIRPGTSDELYIVASSFEPRSVRATSMIEYGAFGQAIVFNYEDTLDSVVGRYNLAQIKDFLLKSGIKDLKILRCRFSDPFSIVRVFEAFLKERNNGEEITSVTIDTTCFTKLHLLLLLRYLDLKLGIKIIRICYTEPLSYATAFGRQLSYGIDKTIYFPYQATTHKSKGIGLIAFLGHERLRLERIVQELEPDLSIVIFGEPGFAKNIQDYSHRVNNSIIHRATYDRQYRLAKAPTNDFVGSFEVLKEQVDVILSEGCDSVYLAALGTKLQTLGIDLLRRANLPLRMLLAYTIPKAYERSMYSQGSGSTYTGLLEDWL